MMRKTLMLCGFVLTAAANNVSATDIKEKDFSYQTTGLTGGYSLSVPLVSPTGPTGAYFNPVTDQTGALVKDSTGHYLYSLMESLENKKFEEDNHLLDERIRKNPGFKHYVSDEKIFYLNNNNFIDNYQDYNKIFIENINDVTRILNAKFYTVRELDFSRTIFEGDNTNDLKPLIDLFKNKTFISLCYINFGKIRVSSDLLLSLKKLQFDDKPLVRDSLFLDRKSKVATAPIRVALDLEVGRSLKKSDTKTFQDLANPVEEYMPIICMNEPYEERLARLKLYIKFVE